MLAAAKKNTWLFPVNRKSHVLKNYQALSDFTRTPAAVKVASHGTPFQVKCALQFPPLRSFHWRTGELPKLAVKAASTAAGGGAFTSAFAIDGAARTGAAITALNPAEIITKAKARIIFFINWF